MHLFCWWNQRDFPTIKIYDSSGSVKLLFQKVKKFTKAHPDIKFVITDRVGDQKDGFAYYAKFAIVDSVKNLEYQLNFEDISKNKVRIGLIFAFDWKKKDGGYGIKADGMPALLKIFSEEILMPLDREQKVKILLNTSFWDNFSIY